MSTKELFDEAAGNVNHLKTKPGDDDLLELYGLYKQATVGDCNTAKPGFLDFKGKAKWEAWNKLMGKSSDDAQKEYVDKVNALIQSIGLAEST